ncbi:MAG: hypothetical protein IPN05_19770 [Sulfuritalea sp.]|nr:hypothetical protein [Sulfuritalea sp.]
MSTGARRRGPDLARGDLSTGGRVITIAGGSALGTVSLTVPDDDIYLPGSRP